MLVTCGLPYTNGPCHLGHLRTYVPGDMYVRYLRHRGEEVVFVCGSDNHGTPIVVSAEEQGVTPKELLLKYHRHFEETFIRMGIQFDRFGMTDGAVNHHRTQQMMQSLIDKGYIYSATISQSFCTTCSRFLPDRYVEGTCPHCGVVARGDECDQGCGKHLEPGEIKDPVCKVCGTRAELRSQEHFFFKLGAFKEFLGTFLKEVRGTDNARNYALGWVNDELHDWCITRTLDWGVRFPGRDDLVVYVWVDAPIGYIAFTEEWAAAHGRDWHEFWCGDGDITHFIGGDITYHHCIFWPALLKGAGYGVPSAIVASGMLKIDDHKFSKSRGYVVWTNEDYLDLGLPADYLRYYLLAYTSHTKELNFSWQAFAERVNNELVNTFGNFVHRTLHFAHAQGIGIPDQDADQEILQRISETIAAVDTAMEAYEFKNTVDSVMTLASYGNNYIQTAAPWKLIKTDRPAAVQVIRNCLQLVRALALLIDPTMPDTASKIWMMLGGTGQVSDHRTSEATENLAAGELAPPTTLFARMEEKEVAALEKTLMMRVDEAEKRGQPPEELISIEEFGKMNLTVGTVLSAEKIPKSSKLLKLIVDIGSEKRQIVSGIAKFYDPEELVGTSVVVITNLQPVTIFGVESRGMILAAGDRAALLAPNRVVEPGTPIR